jgi:hypothetical protein
MKVLHKPYENELQYTNSSDSEAAPTQTDFSESSLLTEKSTFSFSKIVDIGLSRINASKFTRTLLQQFRGLPPSTDTSATPDRNRFQLICSPKALLKKIGVGSDASGMCMHHGLFADAIVYDRNTASVPGFHLPLVLDIVRDNVKNRLLNVLGFTSIFCSVLLILASFVFVTPQAPIPSNVSLYSARLIFCVTHTVTSQIDFVQLPASLSLSTSCPDIGTGIELALLIRCSLTVGLRVTNIDGSPIQNQAITVTESFPAPFFTVQSPFAPTGQTYVRNDGSAGKYSSLWQVVILF